VVSKVLNNKISLQVDHSQQKPGKVRELQLVRVVVSNDLCCFFYKIIKLKIPICYVGRGISDLPSATEDTPGRVLINL